MSRPRGTAATSTRGAASPGASFSRTRRSWLWGGARPYSSTVLEEGSLMAEASPLVRGHARTSAPGGIAPYICRACAHECICITGARAVPRGGAARGQGRGRLHTPRGPPRGGARLRALRGRHSLAPSAGAGGRGARPTRLCRAPAAQPATFSSIHLLGASRTCGRLPLFPSRHPPLGPTSLPPHVWPHVRPNVRLVVELVQSERAQRHPHPLPQRSSRLLHRRARRRQEPRYRYLFHEYRKTTLSGPPVHKSTRTAVTHTVNQYTLTKTLLLTGASIFSWAARHRAMDGTRGWACCAARLNPSPSPNSNQVPWPTLPRGEALWARRVFNAADVAKVSRRSSNPPHAAHRDGSRITEAKAGAK
eukprot:scaffold106635_cov68-Phaeocystis_antarctica.AAC.4